MAAPRACRGARRAAMTPLPAVRTAMAGAGGGRRSAGATPRVTRSSSLRSVVSEPRGGRSPRDPRNPRDRSLDFERPRRSPRIPPLGLPGIGPAPPERRRKRKVTPIDVSELEAWAASMNALFEEAERFHLVVE
ncbi:sororin [Zonotrichia leucophrys gambelii]|uniref:sororin n=1 Tax=Zonotrichia leucophrys gambelii TaxID=257770 RepID=UPI003140624C